MSKYIDTLLICSKNLYFPLLFPILCPIRQEIERGAHVQSIVPGVSDPVGRLSSTAVTSHTWDTSLFSGYEVQGHKTKGRDITCKISNTTHQEADI